MGIIILCGRCIGASNKALAKRRAAEDGLRIIAEKEAAVAAAAIAKQASELQAAIGMPVQKDVATANAAAHEDVPGDNAAADEDMAVDNAAAPAKASGEAEMLTTPSASTENW